MKEAAGEANMTVITIVLIGVVAAAGAIFIPKLITSMKARSCCTEYSGTWQNGVCKGSSFNNGADVTMNYLKSASECQ